jgi:hypothetical protein
VYGTGSLSTPYTGTTPARITLIDPEGEPLASTNP